LPSNTGSGSISIGRDDGSPARRLGRQLKRIRIAAGYTSQAALGKRMGWGEDTISKAETGAQVPSDNVFPAWIEACRTSTDGSRQVLTDGEIAALTELWESARERQFTSAVPESTRPWYEAEAVAEFLHVWDATLVPGLLQTDEYARTLFEALGLGQAEIEELLSVLARRRAILDDRDAVQLTAVLHESVLHQLIGSASVLAGQLAHLLEMSERPNVTIHVVRGPGAYPGLTGPFQLASTHGEADIVGIPAVEDQTSTEPTLTRKAGVLFEKIRRHAFNVEDSRAVIREALHQWESKQ
jgi:transcriptional regulator with XRE-family HTH domain